MAEKLKIIPLGGLNEIGKNMTVLEYGKDIIIVDCGLGFPDEEMYGVDLVIADMTYLVKNKDKIRGMFLTHGHEDHIGGIPYAMEQFNCPIHATRLTAGIVQLKLEEHQLQNTVHLFTHEAGEKVKAGCFTVEFIHVNHSIADAVAFAIKTPVGTIVMTGDFKIDATAEDGMIDLARFGALGKEGVLALLCDSTNVERQGYTPSEKTVAASFERQFSGCNKRIIVTTFASNAVPAAEPDRHGEEIRPQGRRDRPQHGKHPEGLHGARLSEDPGRHARRHQRRSSRSPTTSSSSSRPARRAKICPPSTAWPSPATGRWRSRPSDRVIISASAIPGNEKSIGKIINELYRKGAEVIYDKLEGLHVSGHACQEELKIIHGLLKPRFFIPVHGEQRHLQAHSRLAQSMGMDPKNIFISDIGKVLELTKTTCKWGGTVPSGKILVDGTGVGDVGSVVLRDRKHLAQDGMLVVVVNISSEDGSVITGPDIITRGFVYVKESENLMEELRVIAAHAIDRCSQNGRSDWSVLKANIKNDLSGYLFKTTKRNPMILPVIMEI